jgi:hypothetical protein
MADITHLFDLVVRRNDRATPSRGLTDAPVLKRLTSLKRSKLHFRPGARDQVENGNGTR